MFLEEPDEGPRPEAVESPSRFHDLSLKTWILASFKSMEQGPSWEVNNSSSN